MKRTIAALALSASSSSFALMAPPQSMRTICLDSFESEAGLQYAGSCDQAQNNKNEGREILKDGCAEGRIAVTVPVYKDKRQNVNISSCLPPNVVQL